MQWTKERTTWLGTYHEKRGRWHGIPYVVRGSSTRGLTRSGWLVVVLAAVLLLVVVLAEELWI
jgi:hypothetical protein